MHSPHDGECTEPLIAFWLQPAREKRFSKVFTMSRFARRAGAETVSSVRRSSAGARLGRVGMAAGAGIQCRHSVNVKQLAGPALSLELMLQLLLGVFRGCDMMARMPVV